MKNIYILNNRLHLIVFLIIAVSLLGCEKRETADEKVIPEDTLSAPIQTDTLTESIKPDKTETEQQTAVPDITGTWTGTFDQRPTTLNITQQDNIEFKGKITINYREVINQEVSGKIDPDKNTVTMKDLLHSRYRGKYSGKLSDDKTRYSGTFTMDLDGSKINFSLTKK